MSPISGLPAEPHRGGLTSPTLFNLAVYSVVRYWLSITVEGDALIIGGMGHELGRSLGVFYSDYSIIGSRDP